MYCSRHWSLAIFEVKINEQGKSNVLCVKMNSANLTHKEFDSFIPKIVQQIPTMASSVGETRIKSIEVKHFFYLTITFIFFCLIITHIF